MVMNMMNEYMYICLYLPAKKTLIGIIIGLISKLMVHHQLLNINNNDLWGEVTGHTCQQITEIK